MTQSAGNMISARMDLSPKFSPYFVCFIYINYVWTQRNLMESQSPEELHNVLFLLHNINGSFLCLCRFLEIRWKEFETKFCSLEREQSKWIREYEHCFFLSKPKLKGEDVNSKYANIKIPWIHTPLVNRPSFIEEHALVLQLVTLDLFQRNFRAFLQLEPL